MIGSTEALSSSCLLQGPIEVPTNAMPIEVMARGSTGVPSQVPLKALPNATPIAELALVPHKGPSQCIWPDTLSDRGRRPAAMWKPLVQPQVWPVSAVEPSPSPRPSGPPVGPSPSERLTTGSGPHPSIVGSDSSLLPVPQSPSVATFSGTGVEP
jgi:hypothetical protein